MKNLLTFLAVILCSVGAFGQGAQYRPTPYANGFVQTVTSTGTAQTYLGIGSSTNNALLNGTNVFTGTNTFNTNLIFGSSTLQTQLDSKPTVALTNVATQNGANSFTAAQTHSSTITLNGSGGDYIILNGSVGGVPKITMFNSGIGNIELTANSSGGLGVNANVSATSFSSSGAFYGNGAIGSVTSGGSGGSITAAGVASFWSASGNPTYLSFSENAVANRGVIGYGAGSADLVIKTGGETFAAATTELFRLTSAGSVGIGTASPSARLHVVGGGFRVGSAGSTVTNYASATATLDFGSINSLASEDLTVTVTGAVVNDTVTIGLPAAPTAGIVFQVFVSAANTITVRAHNYTAGAIDPASATYRVGVTSH
jgi:hypothetical protein